jgi:hypothetical protein
MCYEACMKHTMEQAMERITRVKARHMKHVLKQILKYVDR